VTQVHRVGTDTTHAPPCGGPLTRKEQGDAGRAYTPDDAGFRAAGTWSKDEKRATQARTALGWQTPTTPRTPTSLRGMGWGRTLGIGLTEGHLWETVVTHSPTSGIGKMRPSAQNSHLTS
jgi:hypothetical protein